jgi:hypothetical protein
MGELSSYIDPSDYKISMDTRYLRDTYREYWTTVETKERTYYIENLLPQNETRDYRYIATIAEGLTPSRAIQNLARDITLPDGSQLNVEYVPYIDENTDSILADMIQHLDIAE